ncbi:hypothetical protein M758_8G111300 [Ceratodon purpureus]|nr:hypothetical protein M758_8G111300 [Ceratodon purpureus]
MNSPTTAHTPIQMQACVDDSKTQGTTSASSQILSLSLSLSLSSRRVCAGSNEWNAPLETPNSYTLRPRSPPAPPVPVSLSLSLFPRGYGIPRHLNPNPQRQQIRTQLTQL